MNESTFKLYTEHLHALTHEHYNDFMQEDKIKMSSGPASPLPGPTTPMITFTGHTKGSTTSESQVALNNFQKGTKRDASASPIFKNDLYSVTFQGSYLKTIKAQGLNDVGDPDFDLDDDELFNEKQSLVYSVLVTSLQIEKGRELVKEFEGDARTIVSKLHHYHTESNVAQDEVVTLATYITTSVLLTLGNVLHMSFSAISRRNFICWMVLSLTLTRFQIS